MFSFLQKLNSKSSKSSSSQNDRRSVESSRAASASSLTLLRRKDSTASVPSIDFAYNPGNSLAADSYMLNSDLTKVGSISYKYLNEKKNVDRQQQQQQYNHHHNQQDIESKPTKSSSRFSRKSNMSLTSLGSGYFTTGRFYEHKKKSNGSIGTFLNRFAHY
jgi:hypothetical protein